MLFSIKNIKSNDINDKILKTCTITICQFYSAGDTTSNMQSAIVKN